MPYARFQANHSHLLWQMKRNSDAPSTGICTRARQLGARGASFPQLADGIGIAQRDMGKVTFIVLLVALSVGGLAMNSPRLVPSRSTSSPAIATSANAGGCADRYNILLKTAKAALSAGDRATTVDLLKKARQLVSACPALQDGSSTTTSLLSAWQPINTKLENSGLAFCLSSCQAKRIPPLEPAI